MHQLLYRLLEITNISSHCRYKVIESADTSQLNKLLASVSIYSAAVVSADVEPLMISAIVTYAEALARKREMTNLFESIL